MQQVNSVRRPHIYYPEQSFIVYRNKTNIDPVVFLLTLNMETNEKIIDQNR